MNFLYINYLYESVDRFFTRMPKDKPHCGIINSEKKAFICNLNYDFSLSTFKLNFELQLRI